MVLFTAPSFQRFSRALSKGLNPRLSQVSSSLSSPGALLAPMEGQPAGGAGLSLPSRGWRQDLEVGAGWEVQRGVAESTVGLKQQVRREELLYLQRCWACTGTWLPQGYRGAAVSHPFPWIPFVVPDLI